MILLAWGIAAAAMVVVAIGARGRLTPFIATAAVLCLALPGYATLGTTYGRFEPFWAYAAGILLLSGAYAITRRSLGSASLPRVPMIPSSGRALAFTIVVVAMLAAYHFWKVGLPILQSDVETRRFAFTASGFFGLPGRALLFGIPICTYLAIAYASSVGRSPLRPGPLLAITVVVLFASRLAMGFKSGVIEAVITVVVPAVLAWQTPRLRRASLVLALPAGAAVLFAVMVSGLYGTLVTSDQPSLAYLGERSTVIQAIPGFDVLSGSVQLPMGEENTLVNDLQYYVPKYLGLEPTPGRYPFVLVESANILGATPENASFLVPVTVGAFATLVLDFGLGGYVLFAGAGAAYAWLEHRASATRRAVAFMGWVVAIVALGGYLQKGDLVYTALNWGAVTVLVGGLYGVGTLSSGRPQPSPRAVRRRTVGAIA